MEHVRQTDLIRFMASEPEDPHRGEVQRHLAECPACRALFGQYAALWRTLGEWAPDLPQLDLQPGIERKLREAQPATHPFWFRVRRVTRVAAAILVGVGAGYGAAHSWPLSRSSETTTAAAEEEAAADALGIQYLEDASPAGLYATLSDQTAAPDAEEEQP
jgi:predicted anti-sigma-YlaC factor YlaD